MNQLPIHCNVAGYLFPEKKARAETAKLREEREEEKKRQEKAAREETAKLREEREEEKTRREESEAYGAATIQKNFRGKKVRPGAASIRPCAVFRLNLFSFHEFCRPTPAAGTL